MYRCWTICTVHIHLWRQRWLGIFFNTVLLSIWSSLTNIIPFLYIRIHCIGATEYSWNLWKRIWTAEDELFSLSKSTHKLNSWLYVPLREGSLHCVDSVYVPMTVSTPGQAHSGRKELSNGQALVSLKTISYHAQIWFAVSIISVITQKLLLCK